MPILVYFKNPPMSLLLKGNIDKGYIRRLRKAVGNVVEMTKEDGLPLVLIGNANCDLSYITEITKEEMEEIIAKGKAAAARNVDSKRITPVSGRYGKGFKNRPQ